MVLDPGFDPSLEQPSVAKEFINLSRVQHHRVLKSGAGTEPTKHSRSQGVTRFVPA
jgi:hypothetical protein